MKLVLICPLPQEHDSTVQGLSLGPGDHHAVPRVALGAYGAHQVVSALAGAGPRRAAAAASRAMDDHDPDLLIDFGTCAAVEEGVSVGSIVVATRCVQMRISRRGTAPHLPERMGSLGWDPDPVLRRRWEAVWKNWEDYDVRIGLQGSGRIVIAGEQRRRIVRRLSGATAFNWETAAVFRAAQRRGVPAVSLRVVTDLGGSNALLEFFRQLDVQCARLTHFLARLLTTSWLESGPFARSENTR